jgi:hippurate hydrolase
MRLLPEIIDSASAIQEIRRNIHAHPELRFEENRTADLVAEALSSWGISVYRGMGKTGVVGRLDGELGPGKMIGLRADMDALPIPENNPTLPYKTQTEFAHMCGHDGHTATLLAAAEVMIKNRNKIPFGSKVRLLFQPAEEGPGGALPMIKEGCLEGIDEVYGYHNVPNFEEGDVRVIEGAIMAMVSTVKIKILGKGGHGSLPNKVNDVITAGTAIVNQLHTIKSRCIDSKENFIFTLTQFKSGFTYNVFPDEAFM